MDEVPHVIGIDIGSVSISIAEIDMNGVLVKSAYSFHNGNIEDGIKSVLAGFDLKRISGIAKTSSTPKIISTDRVYDNRLSVIEACKHYHPFIGGILSVGGEKFDLVQFDEDGNYVGCKANTGCAAGTGSFLDQQARRLNLKGSRELSEIASKNDSPIPKIASRCAVFAKTDITHSQQEGYSIEQICDGLCLGLAKNIYDTLFKGEDVKSPIVFTGGVSKNETVVGHLHTLTGLEFIVDNKAVYGAVGAALCLLKDRVILKAGRYACTKDFIVLKKSDKRYHYEPLTLKLSEYPDFTSFERYEFQCIGGLNGLSVEVDIYEKIENNEKIDVYLGIDIGSTSTKAVLLNKNRRIMAGFYTRTSGRPVEAVLRLFCRHRRFAHTKKHLY